MSDGCSKKERERIFKFFSGIAGKSNFGVSSLLLFLLFFSFSSPVFLFFSFITFFLFLCSLLFSFFPFNNVSELWVSELLSLSSRKNLYILCIWLLSTARFSKRCDFQLFPFL